MICSKITGHGEILSLNRVHVKRQCMLSIWVRDTCILTSESQAIVACMRQQRDATATYSVS